MMPEAITLLFREAREAFPPLKGKPSDNDLTTIRETFLPILMEIPYDLLGGVHSLMAILTDPGRYAADHGDSPFIHPSRLLLYGKNIATDALTVVRVRREAAHCAQLDNYASIKAASSRARRSQVSPRQGGRDLVHRSQGRGYLLYKGNRDQNHGLPRCQQQGPPRHRHDHSPNEHARLLRPGQWHSPVYYHAGGGPEKGQASRHAHHQH